MSDEECNCGCGKARNIVIREIMDATQLNEEQADARLSEANKRRNEMRKV